MKIFVIFSILLFISTSAFADSWKYKKELKKDNFTFGDVKIIRVIDTRNNDQYPDWSIEIYNKNELMALYKGVSFSDIVSDDKNNIFVGISNRGMPGTAVIIFDSKGNLRLLRNHKEGLFSYCSWSITRVREWYNDENPEIKIIKGQGTVQSKIEVNGCDGKVVNVLSKF